ncbi:DUF5994 family protein [Streptomyces sp. NPDC050732]|uniref:DUF5994 family protein n=1 Tax=Streptomyces sp. NPDC050732 TaxID=3154632 RepID=UPI0034300576
MVITERRSPPTPLGTLTADDAPARLSLKPSGPTGPSPGPSSGLVDGAWWPRSRDLNRELPALCDRLDAPWGRITRVTVNPTHWPVIPHRVPVHGHTVNVGWFLDEQDAHQLMLRSYRVGRWDLLIIPPETDADGAARLMAAACDPQDRRAGSALMAAEAAGQLTAATGAGLRTGTGTEAWESEGGSTPGEARSIPGRTAMTYGQ